MLNSNDIQKIIPHRHPFILVDKVVELEEGKRVKAIKNVTVSEPFFEGHFPDYHVMPGVLIVEALAQAGAIAILQDEKYKGKKAFFAGIDKCRFKKQVTPGDTLELHVEIEKIKGPIGKGKALATVNGEKACSAEITFAIEQ